MRLITEMCAIYGLYVVGIGILVARYGTKDRVPMMVAAWAIPFVVVASVFECVFLVVFRNEPRVRPCPEGLEVAELIVERHRQQMFGGEPQHPRFAFRWARIYALTLERETKQVENIARDFLAYS